MAKFSNCKTSLGIVLSLCIVIVSSAPKPFLLINKGQINVRDSVSRLGHIHSRSSGGRTKFFLGSGLLARLGLAPESEPDFSTVLKQAPPLNNNAVQRATYWKGDNNAAMFKYEPEREGQPGYPSNPNAVVGQRQNTDFQHVEAINGDSVNQPQPKPRQAPAIANLNGNQQQQQYSQDARPGRGQPFIPPVLQQNNFNIHQMYRPSLNPVSSDNYVNDEIAIGSYSGQTHGKRKGLRGLIQNIRGHMENAVDNMKRMVRKVVFKRERAPKRVAQRYNQLPYNQPEHWQQQYQQPQYQQQQKQYPDENFDATGSRLASHGGSNNNNYYFVAGHSGHQQKRNGFLWDRDRNREKRCPRLLRIFC